MTSRTWSDYGGLALSSADLNGIEHDLDIRPQQWQAYTVYTLGQIIVNPAGDVVTVTTAHTSGAAYAPANFAVSATFVAASAAGQANGVATLDGGAHVPSAQLPAASSTVAGSMSTTDKAKLDASTAAPTANTLVARDGNGRAQVAGPSAAADIATKSYVDTSIGAIPPAANPDYGYAWLGFTGNGVCFESLNVAESSDGKSFTLGATSPVYTPVSAGTSLRDPSMMKIGSTYFVAYTANNGLNKNFEIASSTDLLHWTLVATVDCSAATSAYQTWAPELVQDTNGDIYAFFTNVTNGGPVPSIWRVKATDTTGLTTWSAPVAMAWATLPNWPIDATFQYTNGQWYCFYANNNTMFIERATSSTLTGTFTVDKSGDWAGFGYGREAPELVNTNGTTWRLYMDRFSGTSPNWVYAGYGYTESTDLTTWTPLKTVATDPGFPIGQLMRHGAFLKIPDSTTRNTVEAAVAGRPPLRHAEYTGSFATTGGTATGPGPLTLDAGTVSHAGDFISSIGTSQITIGVTGVYSIDFLATFNAGACGGGYMAIKNPAATAIYATQDLVSTAQAWNVGNPNLYLPAGSVLQFFVQTTNSRTGCTARVRITKL